MNKDFDILAYLMGKQAGGGGGDITVESKSISANGTYTAPTGKAYSPVTVSVPNSYAAGDEGKVVSNGALVAQSSDSVTQNGTVDTTLISSLLVNVSGSSGYGYTKLAEQDFTVNTSSTTAVDVGTVNVPGLGLIADNKQKIIYVRVKDKAGKRSGYFLGSETFFEGLYKVGFSHKTFSNLSTSAVTYLRGVFADSIDKTNDLVKIRAQYSQSDSSTIDGTYHVEVYTLDWPDGVSPFATT